MNNSLTLNGSPNSLANFSASSYLLLAIRRCNLRQAVTKNSIILSNLSSWNAQVIHENYNIKQYTMACNTNPKKIIHFHKKWTCNKWLQPIKMIGKRKENVIFTYINIFCLLIILPIVPNLKCKFFKILSVILMCHINIQYGQGHCPIW